jgi:acetolactate synthase-1/2/3 large subunit
MKITVAQAIVRCLEEEGIECAFGISGSHYLAFFNALKDSKIRFISVKHESAAGFMALNYAKVAKKPALILGTAGPGAMNLLNGIAELYKAGIPAFVLTPLVPRAAFGKNSTQEDTGWGNTYSIMDIMRSVTRKSLFAHIPEKIPDLLRELFRFGFYEHCGPVHVGVPSDIFELEIDYDQLERIAYRIDVDERIEVGKIERLAGMIVGAKNPLLLVGDRTVYPNCSKEIRNLVEQFKIPAIGVHNSKGILNEDSKLFAGILDAFGHKSAEKVLKEADLVVSIGANLGEETTIRFDPDLFRNCFFVSMDSDPYEIGRNYKIDFGISGSIRATILHLTLLLENAKYANRLNLDSFSQSNMECNSFFREEQISRTVPMKPQAFFFELSQNIPADSLIFLDVGSVAFWSTRNLIVDDYRYFISANGFSMGQGVAGCIGGKVASPDSPVFCVCGDGAFLMNGMEVATAKQYGLGIIWIVFCEGKYNIVDFGQKLFFNNNIPFCAQLYVPDLSKFAEAFRVDCFVIEKVDDVKTVLGNALESANGHQSSIICVKYDSEEYLPVKPNAVRKMQDLRNVDNFKTSKYFMKAFRNILNEKV